METKERIALSKDMEYIVSVSRLAAIIEMFYQTMIHLDENWYPEELRPIINKLRYDDLNEFRKKIVTWMMNNFYCKGE